MLPTAILWSPPTVSYARPASACRVLPADAGPSTVLFTLLLFNLALTGVFICNLYHTWGSLRACTRCCMGVLVDIYYPGRAQDIHHPGRAALCRRTRRACVLCCLLCWDRMCFTYAYISGISARTYISATRVLTFATRELTSLRPAYISATRARLRQ